MKFSENWLRTFVNPPLATRELADALSMGGLDVEQVEADRDDWVLTTKPTPNRGDCLSLSGIAREVAAVTGAPLSLTDIKPVRATINDRLSVTLAAPQACPRYCGRMVRGVNATATTPEWMTRRLATSGIRPLSALVDITNYVMLELGQPLHAFDAGKLDGGIQVRFARVGEQLTLLNGEAPSLTPSFLVIADDARAVALAGIMGGLDTAVCDVTHDVFLESAFFSPDAISGRSRQLNFSSDSSYRFERGVDFAGTLTALERATQLVLEICGGAAGPVTEACATLPAREPVRLRLARAERLLGIKFDADQASDILRRLGLKFAASGSEFRVTPPSYRFDIVIEEDLIEELARIHGYDRISATMPAVPATLLPVPEGKRSLAAIRRLLVARDYQEIVSYSFVDAAWERDLAGNIAPVALANPIASQMSVMRSTLAGGLIDCLTRNLARKQPRARLFEVGRCFMSEASGRYHQPVRIGGISYGDARHEQWGLKGRPGDFIRREAKQIYHVAWNREGKLSQKSTNAPPEVPPTDEEDPSAPFYRTREDLREFLHRVPNGETVLVGTTIAQINAELHRLALQLTGAGVLVIFIGIAGGWWLANRAIRPIAQISAAAENISGGNLSERINAEETESELGELANTLNRTFGRLEKNFEQQIHFTADASHELRTPIAVLLAETQRALLRERTAEEYRHALAVCERSGERMRALVNSLLELARLDSGELALTLEVCDLARIAREALEFISPLAAQKQIILRDSLTPVEAKVDALKLGQVFNNLLTNAIVHNREGTEIVVALAAQHDHAVFSIADNGAGIPAEALPHLFERFYRLDQSRARAQGGTGLGLSICKAIIEAHGGTITVASEAGKGTTFTVRMPGAG